MHQLPSLIYFLVYFFFSTSPPNLWKSFHNLAKCLHLTAGALALSLPLRCSCLLSLFAVLKRTYVGTSDPAPVTFSFVWLPFVHVVRIWSNVLLRAHYVDAKSLSLYGMYMPRNNPMGCFATHSTASPVKDLDEFSCPSAPPGE